MNTTPVICPSCFRQFEVAAPDLSEVPCDVDYDCEICCHPMRIYFDEGDDEEITGMAYGLNE